MHGIEYVAWPKLLPLTDVIHYDGPGFRSGHAGKGMGIAAFKSDTPRPMKKARNMLQEMEMGTKKHLD